MATISLDELAMLLHLKQDIIEIHEHLDTLKIPRTEYDGSEGIIERLKIKIESEKQ